jgi:hypothetical protein
MGSAMRFPLFSRLSTINSRFDRKNSRFRGTGIARNRLEMLAEILGCGPESR